jgi:hypothetical protein
VRRLGWRNLLNTYVASVPIDLGGCHKAVDDHWASRIESALFDNTENAIVRNRGELSPRHYRRVR